MKLFFTSLILLFSTHVFSQPVAATFEEVEEMGFKISELDSLYPSALHSEPVKGVFNNQKAEFISSYQQLHQDLGNYLLNNGFNWTKKTRLFTRIYFESDGSIDFFLFNPETADLPEEESTRLFTLLNSFIEDYQIPISANTKFAQCSPVTYVPKTTD